jgi:hypothetical protein
MPESAQQPDATNRRRTDPTQATDAHHLHPVTDEQSPHPTHVRLPIKPRPHQADEKKKR